MNVTYIEHMGSDLSVCNAARVSFNKESKWERNIPALGIKELSKKDIKLIKYLATHNHWTPFGHCFLSLRIKAPIFVARQLVKHTVGLCWNEVSRRYVNDSPEFYIPQDGWRKRPDNIKQGSTEDLFQTYVDAGGNTRDVSESVRVLSEACRYVYDILNSNEYAPEMTRMLLPQNTYTEWYWSGSMAAFARVCNLRCKPDTQYETRVIANEIDKIAENLFPVSWTYLRGREWNGYKNNDI